MRWLDGDAGVQAKGCDPIQDGDVLRRRGLHVSLLHVVLPKVVYDGSDPTGVALLGSPDGVVQFRPGDPLAGEGEEKLHVRPDILAKEEAF